MVIKVVASILRCGHVAGQLRYCTLLDAENVLNVHQRVTHSFIRLQSIVGGSGVNGDSGPLRNPLPALRSRPPEIQLGSLGERCKLPQRGLGRSPSRNRIWCVLALKV